MDKIFQKQNINNTKEYISPSKKYKLIINYYTTYLNPKVKTWDYSQGTVYDNENNLVGSIKRNYCDFPFLFFERDNVEYLVSGRSYMSQTIINCSTGEIYDNTDDPHRDTFCWASMHRLDSNTIMVYGCYWGNIYEYRFYDWDGIQLRELKVDEIIEKKYYLMEYSNCVSSKINNGVAIIKHKEEWIKDDNLGIDMLYDDFVIEGHTLEDWEDKIYRVVKVILKLKRLGDMIVVNELVEK